MSSNLDHNNPSMMRRREQLMELPQCEICQEDYDTDLSLIRSSSLHHLPVSCEFCSHPICYSCLQSEIAAAPRGERPRGWIQCPSCLQKGLSAKHPLWNRPMCHLMEAAQNMKKNFEHRIRQVEQDHHFRGASHHNDHREEEYSIRQNERGRWDRKLLWRSDGDGMGQRSCEDSHDAPHSPVLRTSEAESRRMSSHQQGCSSNYRPRQTPPTRYHRRRSSLNDQEWGGGGRRDRRHQYHYYDDGDDRDYDYVAAVSPEYRRSVTMSRNEPVSPDESLADRHSFPITYVVTTPNATDDDHSSLGFECSEDFVRKVSIPSNRSATVTNSYSENRPAPAHGTAKTHNSHPSDEPSGGETKNQQHQQRRGSLVSPALSPRTVEMERNFSATSPSATRKNPPTTPEHTGVCPQSRLDGAPRMVSSATRGESAEMTGQSPPRTPAPRGAAASLQQNGSSRQQQQPSTHRAQKPPPPPPLTNGAAAREQQSKENQRASLPRKAVSRPAAAATFRGGGGAEKSPSSSNHREKQQGTAMTNNKKRGRYSDNEAALVRQRPNKYRNVQQ